MKVSFSSSGPLSREAGFTLIEVTISISIISFAILTMLSLNMVGLSTLRAANDASIEAEITQAIGSEASLSNFSGLVSLQGTYYYDQDGKEVSSSASSYAVVVGAPQSVTCNAQAFNSTQITQLPLKFYYTHGGTVSPGQSAGLFTSRNILVANSDGMSAN